MNENIKSFLSPQSTDTNRRDSLRALECSKCFNGLLSCQSLQLWRTLYIYCIYNPQIECTNPLGSIILNQRHTFNAIREQNSQKAKAIIIQRIFNWTKSTVSLNEYINYSIPNKVYLRIVYPFSNDTYKIYKCFQTPMSILMLPNRIKSHGHVMMLKNPLSHQTNMKRAHWHDTDTLR